MHPIYQMCLRCFAIIIARIFFAECFTTFRLHSRAVRAGLMEIFSPSSDIRELHEEASYLNLLIQVDLSAFISIYQQLSAVA